MLLQKLILLVLPLWKYDHFVKYCKLKSGQVDKRSTTETVDSGSIPGWVKPKTTRIIIGIYSFPAWPLATKSRSVKLPPFALDKWAAGLEGRKILSLSSGLDDLVNKDLIAITVLASSDDKFFIILGFGFWCWWKNKFEILVSDIGKKRRSFIWPLSWKTLSSQ